MHFCSRFALATAILINAAPAFAGECTKVRTKVELPGPAIGSVSKCSGNPKVDECSFVFRGINVGVTGGVVAWKDATGAALLRTKLPFDAKPTDNFNTFLSKQRGTQGRPILHPVRKNGRSIVSTDICMIGQTGEWYELVFEFDRHNLVRIIERMSVL